MTDKSPKRPTSAFNSAAQGNVLVDFLKLLSSQIPTTKATPQGAETSDNAFTQFGQFLTSMLPDMPAMPSMESVSKNVQQFLRETGITGAIDKITPDNFPTSLSDAKRMLTDMLPDFMGFGPERSQKVIQYSMNDAASKGYCAMGVRLIGEKLGWNVPQGIASATDWPTQLTTERGWIKLDGVRPEDAPPGSVLYFSNYEDAGKKVPAGAKAGSGAYHGHVEIVCEDQSGNRSYVSDAARRNYGGSVPGNFGGVYYYVGPEAAKEFNGTFSPQKMASMRPDLAASLTPS